MKRVLKSRIFIFIITAIIFTTTGALATTLVAKNIEFTPKDDKWEVNNVKDAIDDLYTRVKNNTGSNNVLTLHMNNGQISSTEYLTANFDTPITPGKRYYYSVKVVDLVSTYDDPSDVFFGYFDYTGPDSYYINAHQEISCLIDNNKVQAIRYGGAWYNIYLKIYSVNLPNNFEY